MAKNFKGAPLFSTNIRAGFQVITDDDIEKRISFDKEFDLQSPSIFVFHVSGDSMINMGIYEGDYVVIKKTDLIKDKDIVIANVDGLYTLKIYRKKGNEVWLEAANPEYKTIKPKMKLEIFGKAIGLVRNF